jgi:hypothetical protein
MYALELLPGEALPPRITLPTPNPYAPITMVPRASSVRAPWAPQLAMAVAKQFLIREDMKLQLKAEAFNLTNTPIFGGPNTANPNTAPQINRDAAGNPRALPGDPGYCNGYGCVGNTQQNFPRQIQLSLKLLF